MLYRPPHKKEKKEKKKRKKEKPTTIIKNSKNTTLANLEVYNHSRRPRDSLSGRDEEMERNKSTFKKIQKIALL